MMTDTAPVSLDPMQPQRAKARNDPLPSGGGGGTYDGMEARVAILETHIEHIRDDLAEIRKNVRELRSEGEHNFKTLVAADDHNFKTLLAADEKNSRTLLATDEHNFKTLLATDEKNFRLLFGALIAVALGLASLMAKGFHWF